MQARSYLQDRQLKKQNLLTNSSATLGAPQKKQRFINKQKGITTYE